MGIELIGHEDPARLWFSVERRLDVRDEVGLGSSWTQRRIRWRSIPRCCACASLSQPAADNSTMRHRCTNCCDALFERAQRSNSSRCRSLNSIDTERDPGMTTSKVQERLIMIFLSRAYQRVIISAEDI
jgi:hypothetical protein